MMAWLHAIGAMIAFFCFITAFLDMGMNGGRYAGWFPYGMAIGTAGLMLACA